MKSEIFNILLIFMTKSVCIFSNNIQYNGTTETDPNFIELEITGLQGTLHYETLSNIYNVSKLKILDNRLTKIEPGALCAPTSVKSIELNFAANPEAPTLTKDVFRQCNLQLQELFIRLDFDNPSQIDENALEDLNLRALSFQCHRIGILKKEFLNLNKHNLTKLVLSNCFIHTIERDFFNQMEYLEEVEISYNRNLTHLPKRLFGKSRRLRRLFLQYNRIRELDWDEFSGLSQLEELDLSGNRLAFFHARKISQELPSLKRLKILKNLLPCKLKKQFSDDLMEKMNQSVEVVYTSVSCKEY